MGERSASADGGEEATLPFAVELGSATSRAGGFAVGALRAQGGGVGALVALLDENAGAGKIIDLGRTHGDVDPPRVAARGARLVVAVPDSDAGSHTVKLAEVTDGGASWGATLRTGRDDSHAFDVALGETHLVVVWDELDKPKGHSVIRLAAATGAGAPVVSLASPPKTDAEAPRLVTRDGGFWLAWIAHAPLELPRGESADGGDEDERVARWLEIVPLDAAGKPTAEPRAVTERTGTLSAFDLAAAPEGSALVAWRRGDDRAEGPASSASLTTVAPDGTVRHAILPDPDLGPGVPSLVVDAEAKPSRTWLAIGSITDVTRLAPVSSAGTLEVALAADPAVDRAEPLAAGHGRLLFATGRGRAAELFAFVCGAP